MPPSRVRPVSNAPPHQFYVGEAVSVLVGDDWVPRRVSAVAEDVLQVFWFLFVRFC